MFESMVTSFVNARSLSTGCVDGGCEAERLEVIRIMYRKQRERGPFRKTSRWNGIILKHQFPVVSPSSSSVAPQSSRRALDSGLVAWPCLLRIPSVKALEMFVAIQVQSLVLLQQEVLRIDDRRLGHWQGVRRICARWVRPILLVVLEARLPCLHTAGSGS